MNTLYELHFDYINILPSIICVFTIALVFFRTAKAKTKTVLMKGIVIVAGLVFIAGSIFIGRYYVKDYRTLKNDVENGYAMTISGTVENFHPQDEDNSDDTEHFDVNGVHFEYSPDMIISGYNTPQYDGGVITGDGQRLQIKYVPYETENKGDVNIIVQIDEINI